MELDTNMNVQQQQEGNEPDAAPALKEETEAGRAVMKKENGQQSIAADVVIKPGESNEAPEIRICVTNMPKFASPKEVKNLLKQKDLDARKVKVGRGHAFMCFGSPEAQSHALGVLEGLVWHGRTLKAAIAKPLKEDGQTAIVKAAKSAKLAEGELPSEAKLLDTVNPLHKVPYSEQLTLKQTTSKQLLTNIATEMKKCGVKQTFDESIIATIRPSPVTERYRNKCEFAVGKDVQGTLAAVGFVCGRRPGGQSYVLSANKTLIISKSMAQVAEHFQQYIRTTHLPVFDDAKNTGFWRMLTVREFLADLMVIVTVNVDVQQAATDERVIWAINSLKQTFATNNTDFRCTSLYIQYMATLSDRPNYELVLGAPYVYETVLNRRFRVSPGAFFQTNTVGAERLYGMIGDIAKVDKDTVLLDICCGTGTIGISLADRCKLTLGIEICGPAVQDARENAVANLLPNAKFLCGAAETVFQELKYMLPPDCPSLDQLPNLIGVVDPPRAGLHPKVLLSLRKLKNLRRLLFVSCDPKAAVKNFVDLCRPESNKFAGNGFVLREVHPMDMFPQTKHFEWILLFDR